MTVELTVETVRERVQIIARLAETDDEAAHAKEDELHREVLQHFAATGDSLAIEALKTLEIQFSRWCA